MSIEIKDLEKQRKMAVEMGGYLKHFAETYDLQDDEERHNLRHIAEAFSQEQTRYEYMKMQATHQSSPAIPQGGELNAGVGA